MVHRHNHVLIDFVPICGGSLRILKKCWKLRIVKFRLIPEDSEQLISIIIGWRLRERALELGSLGLHPALLLSDPCPGLLIFRGRLWCLSVRICDVEWRHGYHMRRYVQRCWYREHAWEMLALVLDAWRELLIRGVCHMEMCLYWAGQNGEINLPYDLISIYLDFFQKCKTRSLVPGWETGMQLVVSLLLLSKHQDSSPSSHSPLCFLWFVFRITKKYELRVILRCIQKLEKLENMKMFAQKWLQGCIWSLKRDTILVKY